MDETEKRRLVAQSERVLTNYFNKNMDKLKNAVSDSMSFNIVNKKTTTAAVALACGGIPTEGIYMNDDVPVPHNHDTTFLAQRGYQVDAILDDVSDAETTTATVKIGNLMGQKSLRQQLRSLVNAPRYIKCITMTSDDTNMFYDGKVSLGTEDPFNQAVMRTLNLNDYFSVNQQATNKIVVPFNYGELQWNENLLMILFAIPGDSSSDSTGTHVGITVDFYPED